MECSIAEVKLVRNIRTNTVSVAHIAAGRKILVFLVSNRKGRLGKVKAKDIGKRLVPRTELNRYQRSTQRAFMSPARMCVALFVRVRLEV